MSEKNKDVLLKATITIEYSYWVDPKWYNTDSMEEMAEFDQASLQTKEDIMEFLQAEDPNRDKIKYSAKVEVDPNLYIYGGVFHHSNGGYNNRDICDMCNKDKWCHIGYNQFGYVMWIYCEDCEGKVGLEETDNPRCCK